MMMQRFFIITSLLLAAACSETNLDDLDSDEIAEIEEQIETEAQSLEKAADEAVKVLEEEIQAELEEEGISMPQKNSEPSEPAKKAKE